MFAVECRLNQTTPTPAQKGLRSDPFLWEGTVEGVTREGEFVDVEGGTAQLRLGERSV